MTFLRSTAITLALSALGTAALAADPELTVFDWAGFEEPSIFQGYIDKHGTGPTYAFYGDDDEAYQKLASGYKADVAHPCSQMVSKYRDAGLIEPWDTSRIAAFADIDPRFLNSPVFKDDQGVWYIPTDFGSTAIAYNTEKVPAEDVATLNVFINPAYQGRTTLPDSADDVWALAYLATGVTDWTHVTDEQFQKAADWLREAHKNVSAYWADPADEAQMMASGAVDVAWSWNDVLALLRKENYPVGYQRAAKEGSSTFFCGFVNLKSGQGSEDKMYDFINAWLDPSSAKGLLDTIGYGSTNVKGLATVSDDPRVKELGETGGPILAQTPNDPAQREKQLAEFEKIKAGF